MPQFIELEKLAVGGLTELSVDQPVDRPRVIFQTVEPSVDRDQDTESKSLCPVDRGFSREQSFPDGRPGRSTGHLSELGVHVCARRSTAFRTRSTAEAWKQKFRDLKVGLFS